MCEVHFGNGDILIGGFRLNPVHAIGEPPYESEAEFDFYMDTGADCYLLRVRNNAKNTITLCEHDANNYDLIYIVAEKLLSADIFDELICIVNELKKIEVPTKIFKQIEFPFSLNR
jgi:hypothetical protein